MDQIVILQAAGVSAPSRLDDAKTLQRVVRSLPLPALFVDRHGIIVFVNDEAAALLPTAAPGRRIDLSALANGGAPAPAFRLFRVPAVTLSGVRAECVVVLRPAPVPPSSWLH